MKMHLTIFFENWQNVTLASISHHTIPFDLVIIVIVGK